MDWRYDRNTLIAMKAAASSLKDFQNATHLACKIDDIEDNGCPDGRFIDQVMAAATVTTGDNGVAYFINGSQLRSNRIPHVLSIFPTTGPVGTPFFVLGAHFSNSEGLACSFGSMNVPARWLSTELLQCDSPIDSSLSDSVVVEVKKDERLTTSDGHSFSFNLIKVFEVVPPTGPISGGAIVHIIGEGFPASSDLAVRFGPTEVEATFVNSSFLRCVSPPASSLASELSHEVSVVHGGAIVDGAVFTYFPITYVAFIEPTWGFSTHDTPITLHGVGFVNSTRLACSFGSDSGVTQSLALATFTSVTRAFCEAPSGMVVGDYRVSLTTNGQDLTESKANFIVLKEPSILSISPINLPSGPSEGGTAIHVQGIDFERVSGLKCSFGSTAVDARWESSTSLWCTSPGKGKHPGLIVTKDGRPYASPLFSFRYWDDDNGSNSNSSTMPAHEKTQSRDFQILDSLYGVQDVGGRKVSRATIPSVVRIVPNHGPNSGGTTILVSGTDFVDSDELKCTFGSSAIAGRWLSPALVACISPQRSDRSVVPFGINLDGVASTWPKSTVTFIFEDSPTVDGLKPSSGPRAGGTLISITGHGFFFSSGLRARFGETIVSVVYVSPEELRCTSPPFHVAGPVEVFVDDWDKTFTDTGHELAFMYTEDLIVDGIYPTRGSMEGGLRVAVYGQGFTNMTDLGCVFARASFVEARFLSHEHIECETPAFSEPGSYPLEITNGVDLTSDGNIFTYMAPPRLFFATPDSGSIHGGTVVIIEGANFVDSEHFACHFGTKAVPARWLSPVLGRCIAPSSGTTETITVPLTISFSEKPVDNGVDFIFFSPPTVHTISPTGGPVSGGNIISVVGEGFWFSSNLRIRFGRTEVSATFVNSRELHCLVPRASFSGVTSLLLSFNGVEFMSQEAGMNYTYFSPMLGQKTANLSALGVKRRNLSGLSDFTSRTMAEARDNKELVPLAPFVSSIYPRTGPLFGGTMVHVRGFDFIEAQELRCMFGPETVSAQWSSPNQVQCMSPGVKETQVVMFALEYGIGNTSVSVDHELVFVYNMGPTLLSISPGTGSTDGGTTVSVIGRDFAFSKVFRVHFGPVEVPTVFVNTSLLRCTTVAAFAQTVEISLGVPHQGASLTYTFQESAMRGRRTAQTQIECKSPSPEAAAAVSALSGISFDDQRRTTGVAVHVKRPVNILSVTPNAGPTIGGETVSVNGTGFIFTGIIRVRFGDSAVSCTFLSEESLSCVTPPGEAGAAQLMYDPMNDAPIYSSVSFQYYDTADFEKGVVRSVVGIRFNSSNMAGDASSEEISCEVPPSHSKTGDEPLDCVIENNQPSLVLAPSSGPTKGGTPIVISGGVFPRNQGIECLFGEAKVVEALWLSADSVQCEAPAWEGGSKEVYVSITVRGYSFGTGRGLFTYTRILLIALLPVKGEYGGGTVVSLSGENFDANIQYYCWFGSQKTPAGFVNESLLQCLSPPMIDGGHPSSVNLSVTAAGDSQDGGLQSSLSFTYTTSAEVAVADLSPSGGPLHAGTSVVVTFKNGFGKYRPSIHCDFGEIGSSLSRWLNETAIECVVPIAPYRGKVLLSFSSSGESSVIDKVVPFWYFPLPMVSYVHPLEIKGDNFVVTVTGGNFMNLGPVSCQLGGVLVRALWKSMSVIQCPFVGVVPGVYDIRISNNMADFVDAGVRLVVNAAGGSGMFLPKKGCTEGSPHVEVFDPSVELLSYERLCPSWDVAESKSEENNFCMMMDNGTVMDDSVPFTVCDSHEIRSDAQDYSFVSPDVIAMNSALLTRNTLLGCDHVAKNGTDDSDGIMIASGIAPSINALNSLRPLLPFRQRETAVHGVFPRSFPSYGGSVVHLSGTGFRNYANGGLLCFFDGSTDPALWVSDSLVLCRVPHRVPDRGRGMMTFRIRNSDDHYLLGMDIMLTETGDNRLQGYTLSPGAVDEEEERSVMSSFEQFASSCSLVGGSHLCLFGEEIAVPVGTPVALAPGGVRDPFVLPNNDISTLGDSKCQEYPTADGVRALAANNFAQQSQQSFSCRENRTKISALLHPNGLEINRSASSRLWNETYTVPDSSSPPPVVIHILPANGFAGDGRDVFVFGHNFIQSEDLMCLFGDHRAVHMEWISSTQLRCVSPHLPPSTVQVKVTINGEKINAASMTSAYYKVHYPFFISSVNASLGPVGDGTIVKVSGSYFPSTGGMDCVLGSITVSATILDRNSLECVIPTLNGNEAEFGLHYMGRTVYPQWRSTLRVKTLPPPVTSEFVNSDPITVVIGANNSPKDGKKSWFRGKNVTIEAASTITFASPKSGDGLDTVIDITAIPDVESINPTMGSESGGTDIRLRGTNFYNSSRLGCLICTMDSERVCVHVPGRFVSPEELACISPGHKPGLVMVRGYHGHHAGTSYGQSFLYFPAPHVTNIAPRAGPLEGGTMVIVSGSHLAFTGSAKCRFGEQSVNAAFHAKGFVCTSPQAFNINLPTVFLEVSLNGVDFTSDGNEFEYFGSSNDSRLLAMKSNYGHTRGDTQLDVESAGVERDTSDETEYEDHNIALALSNSVIHRSRQGKEKDAEDPSLRSDNRFRTQMHLGDIPSIHVGAMGPTSGVVSRRSTRNAIRYISVSRIRRVIFGKSQTPWTSRVL